MLCLSDDRRGLRVVFGLSRMARALGHRPSRGTPCWPASVSPSRCSKFMFCSVVRPHSSAWRNIVALPDILHHELHEVIVGRTVSRSC